MHKTIPLILACMLFFHTNNSFPADKSAQHTKGNQSPIVNIGPGGRSTIIYGVSRADHEKLIIQNYKTEEERNEALRAILEIVTHPERPSKKNKDILRGLVNRLPSNDQETTRFKKQVIALIDGDLKKASELIEEVKRTQLEFEKHLNEVLDVMEINLQAYKNGNTAGWSPVAAQLYQLLCDSHNGPVLVERVMPKFSLHPLLKDLTEEVGKWVLYTTKIHMSPNGITLELFDLQKPRIPLSLWLKQTVAIININDRGVPITLGSLITDVWNQEVGHFNEKIGMTLQATSGGRVVEKGTRVNLHQKYLISIAEYVLPEIRVQLSKKGVKPTLDSYGQ